MSKEVLKDDDLSKATGGTDNSGKVTVIIDCYSSSERRILKKEVTFDSSQDIEKQCRAWCCKRGYIYEGHNELKTY